ncbi:MAG: GDP-mannose 4,6-dehydratase [Verrucomicrobiota bacterium]
MNEQTIRAPFRGGSLSSAYEETFGGFFKGKRVLVTGAAGVKGAWLCTALIALGASVTGMDVKTPSPTSNFALSGLKQRMRFRKGDVTNPRLVHELVEGQDCVFHLAARVLVHDCEANPLQSYLTNTFGTATMLEAFRRSATARYAVFVTTDKVYRAKEREAWVEHDPLFASGTYAISKACAEQVIADYRVRLESAGKRWGVARAGNVLVGGDFYSSSKTNGAGRIAADCFEALLAGRRPEIFTPSFTRPYTYGLDILSGYMSLMARLDDEAVQGEAFNFGPHELGGIPNGVLAAKICQEWGNDITPRVGPARSEPFATQALCWDKAQNCLGWQPAYELDQAIEDTVAWYRGWSRVKDHPSPGALRSANRELLQRHYEKAARRGIWWAASSAPPGKSVEMEPSEMASV